MLASTERSKKHRQLQKCRREENSKKQAKKREGKKKEKAEKEKNESQTLGNTERYEMPP